MRPNTAECFQRTTTKVDLLKWLRKWLKNCKKLTMFFNCCLYGALITVLISRVAGKSSETDSFDESFEESPILSPELKKALQPTEDALFSFINRLVNTGYSSSKIALNRVEKASKRRKEFGERLEQFLVELSRYQSGEEEITEKLWR